MAISNELDEGIDFSDIEEKYKVRLEEGFDHILVVDGVPVIDKSKFEKLSAKIAKEFTRKGAAIKPDDISMPWNDKTGKSNGYAFIEFRTADAANYALNEMHGHPFDAKHTFLVNRFTDIEKFVELTETYVEPQREEYHPKEHLRAWLADLQGRDQYVTYRGDEVSIRWHGRPSQCELAYEDHQNLRTELYVSWSPLGTYIATLHRQGIRLWGGPSFQLQARFFHPLVRLIDFSPCEQYLVTWSHEPIVVADDMPQGPRFFSPEDEGNHIAVWDIKTGHLLRSFPSIHPEGEGSKKQMAWPALKWSADDKYTARLSPGQQISVYELPSMGLQGKKSLKIEGVVDFEWCPHGEKEREDATKASKKPTESMLAYWTPEVANQPARVTLLNFPDRTVLRQKNLFNVSECRLYWQNQGDFLCVRVDRHTKTKKSIFCNLEIFRVREKDFPVEVVELKDTVTDFSWEPKGERFAIVSSSDPNLGNPGPGVTIKTDVSFYQLDRSKNDFKPLRTLAGRTTNTIRWSPRGRHVVLATVGSTSKSELEFWDLDFNSDDAIKKEAPKEEWSASIQQLGIADHYGVTDVEWDPSGRYLATAASAWTHTVENGYAIWDFRGQEIEKRLLDRFKQFLWRPRAPSLLTKEEKRTIRKNLKEYSRAFDEADAAEETTVSAELVAQRKRAVDEWNAWRVRVGEEVEEVRRARGELVARIQEETEKEQEQDKEEIEVWIDEVIDQFEEVVE
ncbi:translation initiation factor eIF-3b [Multifurca ochricompacta]|uniref:Eukaryotic translation initiation factor 3 subunit B n=1 Tax=Multifurca ochricompacta TaxID=376703 RepID=A0AAD4M4G9_9AGAM|nr:translation initiation factor eIF-3b [Multifurca ochricompacta]